MSPRSRRCRGSSASTSAGTVDQWPKNVSSALLFGGMWTFPIPDLDRTDHLIVMGANPHASQGSLLAAPDLLSRLGAIRARGGKVVVIDPRRTGTAKHADEWVAIRGRRAWARAHARLRDPHGAVGRPLR
jgi:anaerobic selenocysteine-containing dehydrogenase